MPKRHLYRASIHWDAGAGGGTGNYKSYSREHVIRSEGKPEIVATSAFHSAAHYNPEDLLIAALSSCHMLWYLHFCSQHAIVVVKYEDNAEGAMIEDAAIGGKFERAMLRPRVTIAKGDREKALALHHEAHRLCFIANSVNFPVDCEPKIEIV
ncbi:MAG TPA: OsmC family protein [Xanthobacteraceae bacterium]|nr:OsmC family protein [Xanthobacteraceae bacterium]